MKAIVLGASGQLGSCLEKVVGERNFTDISFPSEQDGNILDEVLLDKLFLPSNHRLLFIVPHIRIRPTNPIFSS